MSNYRYRECVCEEAPVQDSLVGWCPNCTPRVEILRASLWALALRVEEIIEASDGFKLKPDQGIAEHHEGGLFKWDDAIHSCWLGSLDTAWKALKIVGLPYQGQDGDVPERLRDWNAENLP